MAAVSPESAVAEALWPSWDWPDPRLAACQAAIDRDQWPILWTIQVPNERLSGVHLIAGCAWMAAAGVFVRLAKPLGMPSGRYLSVIAWLVHRAAECAERAMQPGDLAEMDHARRNHQHRMLIRRETVEMVRRMCEVTPGVEFVGYTSGYGHASN